MINPSETDQILTKLLALTSELIELNKLDEAEKFLAEILKYKPDELTVPFQRGILLVKKGDHENALAQFMQVHERYPDHFENLNNIGTAYSNLKKYDEAIAYYKKSLKIRPDSGLALGGLATCLFRYGELDDSIKYFRKKLEVDPEAELAHSNILLSMIYSENVSPLELAEEAKQYGRNISRIFPEKTCFKNERKKNRKLRVGYVSPDFKDHPVQYFLGHLLRNHNREHFEIFAYSNTMNNNPVMARMKKFVDVWRDIWGLDDEKCCELIINDNIDILVDVAGHTAHNKLKIFAKRAAPVQVTWLGFPATTGIQNIDYRITDSYAEPEGMTEHLNAETLWRLPRIFCAYEPHNPSPQVIDHPPFEDNGYVTFGCFNNFVKVRDPVLATWGKILHQVSGARLLLEIENIDNPEYLKKTEDRLRRQNVALDSVILRPRVRSSQFSLYNQIDIALDPFPCVGGTTSFDTLWMGVPLITLAGRHFGSRMGVSILENAGLQDLIAENTDEYISIAVNLAKDKNRLKTIRHKLRDRFSACPAMNQESFAQDMEDAYRKMWHKYCDSSP